jgi:hypothetical protein
VKFSVVYMRNTRNFRFSRCYWGCTISFGSLTRWKWMEIFLWELFDVSLCG